MSVTPPDLEQRFIPPENWQWHGFERVKDRNIRYGFSIPQNTEAVVIYLPGLAEPAEKSFEIAQESLSRGYGFAVMDWFGQGGSGRYLENLHKRHAGPFEDDLADFHEFLTRLSSQINGKKLIMLAHSMGGNLGLRYIHDHPGVFKKAICSAPMIGIYALKPLFPFMRNHAASFINKIAGNEYVIGGSDWYENKFKTKLDKQILSSDPVRGTLQDQWFSANPELAVGDVTYGWVYEAQKSCTILQKQLSQIHTHVLIGIAGHDILVDNAAAKHAVSIMPHAELMAFPESRHEILMERDEIRNAFLDAFYRLI